MLYYVDFDSDGCLISEVADQADCEPVSADEFRTTVRQFSIIAKRRLPQFLDVSDRARPFVRVYQGFLDTSPHITNPVRLTIVGRDCEQYVALHTRLDPD